MGDHRSLHMTATGCRTDSFLLYRAVRAVILKPVASLLGWVDVST